MSVNITPTDLSAAVVGTSKKIDWTGLVQMGTPIGTRAGTATLRLFNESNCGLELQLSGIAAMNLPAGGWGDVPITGQNSLTWTVLYVIAGPSPNTLIGTLYEPGEPIPRMPILGNSAVGIGGTVATSTSSSLKNDGNGPGLQIIESTPSDQTASSLGIDNDGSGFWKVLSAGVLRIVLNVVRGNAGALKASIQFGDSGDATITTLYGSLQGGQPANVGVLTSASISSDGAKVTTDGSGNLTANSLKSTTTVTATTSLSTDAAKVTTDGSGNMTVNSLKSNTTLTATTTLSTDAAKVTTDGSGNLTVNSLSSTTSVTATTTLSSDSGRVVTDGSGNLDAQSIAFPGIASDGSAYAGAHIFNSSANNALSLKSQQSGASAQGIMIRTWNGTASVVPFSFGGQFGGALSWFDNSGTLNLNGSIVGVNGGMIIESQQSGASANGITFETWSGTANKVPLSVGGQFNSALSWFDNSGNLDLNGSLLGVNGGMIIESQQSGSANGLTFETWSGTANKVPLSIGGQFNSALSWFDNSGNLDLDGNILSVNGGMIVETQQSGAANGLTFEAWTGTANSVPFSVGGQFNSAAAWVGNAGTIFSPLYQPVSGSIVFQSQQSGAANGARFTTWSGTASVAPFSIGGQFGSALSWIDTSGDLVVPAGAATFYNGAASGGASLSWVSGNNAMALNSKLSGASATGTYFGTWSGSASAIPFSVGGQFNSALSWVDGSGNYNGPAGCTIPTTRNGTATSVAVFTGANTPSSPPTGSLWVQK